MNKGEKTSRIMKNEQSTGLKKLALNDNFLTLCPIKEFFSFLEVFFAFLMNFENIKMQVVF